MEDAGGIIVIDKPQGMTSHDVVSFLRRKTGVKRIGHSGTLDPMATGVLPVYIGKATRLIEYAGRPDDEEAKIYRCTMKLGLETDTQDIWGAPLSDEAALPARGDGNAKDKWPGAAEIEQVLKGFEGEGAQRPPMYSAVKVGGRKLYEYARKGVEIDESLIKPRRIYIKHICVKDMNETEGSVSFDVHCSKGVYIRTLCVDAGRLLGCGAVMSGLIRLKSDGFGIDDAIPLDSIRDEGTSLVLAPLDTPVQWLPRVDLPVEKTRKFCQGQVITTFASETGAFEAGYQSGLDHGALVRVYTGGAFVGIGRISENALLTPEKVIEINF